MGTGERIQNIYEVYFDGGSKGNPGIGGSGAWCGHILKTRKRETNEIWHGRLFLGKRVTNNQAEYMGILHCLTAVL